MMLQESIDITFDMYSSESNDTDETSTETETETDTYSPSSSTTDHSLSLNGGFSPLLSIDKVILRPILDSTISEDECIAKEENEFKSEKSILKQKKLNWKLKRVKSVKVWNGFTKLLSLFASDCIVKEKQIKKVCHLEISELLSNKKSRHCEIIKNFEIIDNKSLCDITINIFKNSDKSKTDDEQCFDIWNIGLIMLFMIIGKNKIIKNIHHFQQIYDLQTFLWNLYINRYITTNLFDLLYFFMFIFETTGTNKLSRYNQIGQHLFFHK